MINFPNVISISSNQIIVLASEVTGFTWRGAAVTISMSGFPIGGAVLSLVAKHLPRGWKWLCLCSTVPYTVIFLFTKFLPESPRWLIQQGRKADVITLTHTIAKWNRRHIPESFEISCVKKERDGGNSSALDVVMSGAMKAIAQAYFTFTLGKLRCKLDESKRVRKCSILQRFSYFLGFSR